MTFDVTLKDGDQDPITGQIGVALTPPDQIF